MELNIFEWIVIIIIGVTVLLMLIGATSPSERVKLDEEFKTRLEEVGIKNDNIKAWISIHRMVGCLIYTKDNRLFKVWDNAHNYAELVIKEIDLNSILDIDVDITCNIRNSMQIISLTPTFNSYNKITRASIKITTEDEVLDLYTDNVVKFNPEKIFIENTHRGFTWQQTIDEMNKMKLLLMKKINS